MGRIRLALLFSAALGSLFGAFQEAAAQSPLRLAKPIAERDDSPAVARLPLPHPKPLPRGPEVFFCETPDPSCRTNQDSFILEDLRDLYVFVTWPAVGGQHVQTVQFFLPDGSVYATKKTQFIIGGIISSAAAAKAFRTEVAPAPPARHLMADANRIHSQGIPSLLMKSRGESAVLTVLPVGGTYITQRSLNGTWHVRVFLDDRLALESDFTLVSRQPASVQPQAGELQ